ncbi:MAG TPA: hypothetical protein VFE36_15860 [Candidatus Baltobacteraceae bacterium]|nr:hypothetical protein [Candidatus Baltobacteraceae bacterium]
MQPLFIASVLAGAAMASPSPSPAPQPTLKTIITVHSSAFCSVLGESVRPALAGLIRNDQLIERGHTAYVDAGYRATHGAIDSPSVAQVIGPPATSQSSADAMIVESRQRQLAKNLEDNIDAIDTLLSDKKRFAVVTATDDAAKLLSVQSQLDVIAAKQRTAVNIISGQVEGSELATLFNRDPTWGGADATHGVSPLEAMKAGHGGEGDSIYNVWQAAQQVNTPFYDPYQVFTEALGNDQTSIAAAEDVASKAIVEAASGCK